MQTKLTLRLEEPLIKAAKKYSKTHGKSLSRLIADYLSLITQISSTNESSMQPLPPITQALQGILSGKKISEDDYKNHLTKKYQ